MSSQEIADAMEALFHARDALNDVLANLAGVDVTGIDVGGIEKARQEEAAAWRYVEDALARDARER